MAAALFATTATLAMSAAPLQAVPPCRPGVAGVPLETGGARLLLSPCGGGVESIKLLDPQFRVHDARPPSGAVPGWAAAKWAAGPLELVATWDARWDPFQLRLLAREATPITVAVTLPGAATATSRTFSSLEAMARELPRYGVVAAEPSRVELVWPDPAQVSSPLHVRKILRPSADLVGVTEVEIEVWWQGERPLAFAMEHVVSAYHDPAASGGSFLDSLAGPPDIPGVAWHVDGETNHLDASSLADADPEERALAAPPTWVSADSRYFLLAILPGEGFGPASSARLHAVGNGVLQAIVRGESQAIAGGAGCLPRAVAGKHSVAACEDDFALLGLSQPIGARIDAAALDQAVQGKGGTPEVVAAAERVRRRPVSRATMRWYTGAKEIGQLEAVGSDLDAAIDFGWFGAIARPLLFVLKVAHDFTGSWPIAILVLTILVKALLWPVMGKSMRSMRKMASLKPELDKIRADLTAEAKKRGDSNPDPTELNKRTFALYQTHGVNPLGGCLPMLLQMPVYIALYRTISSSVELYNQPLFLWITDLTRHDPYYVLPILLSVLMVLQQRITPMTVTDEAQRKLMMYVMPVLFGVLMLSLPSGLTLYILTNTVLSMGQTWWLQRSEQSAPMGPSATGKAR